jgi:hypothetical protein
MGTNYVVNMQICYFFTYEFVFIKSLLKSDTCPIVLHRLFLVHMFVDDFFVTHFQTLRISCIEVFLVATYTQKLFDLNCTL